MIGASIIALLLGIVLIFWTAHILFDIIGAVLVIAAVVWLIKYFIGNRSRTNL